jgi:hypothetical protein
VYLQEILWGEHGLYLLSSRLEQVAGSYEWRNECSDFIKWFMHITLPFYLLSFPIAIEGYCWHHNASEFAVLDFVKFLEVSCGRGCYTDRSIGTSGLLLDVRFYMAISAIWRSY